MRGLVRLRILLTTKVIRKNHKGQGLDKVKQLIVLFI